MTVQDFFFCYDKRTMKYLRYDKGIQFVTRALHAETKAEFWLFVRTAELEEALKALKAM